MDIYKLFDDVQKTNIATPLEDLKALLLVIQNQRSKLEYLMFDDYCLFRDKKEYQIQKNQTYLDKQRLILNNVYQNYYQKEEKYKYPDNLTSIQNKINQYELQKYNNILQAKKNRKMINENLILLETLVENEIVLYKKII